MKIYTKSFKYYSKLILSCQDKTNRIYENIYLNFEDNYAYFFSNDKLGRIKFASEGDKEKNFFVNTQKFLFLCDKHDFLELNDKTFKNNNDTYCIEWFEDYIDLKNFDKEKNTTIYNIEETAEFINNIKETINYCAIDDPCKLNLQGIFFKKDRIIATDKQRLIEVTSDKQKWDLKISYNVAKLLAILHENIKLKIYKGENYYIINCNENEFDLYIPDSLNLEFVTKDGRDIDTTDGLFIHSYNHETFILVDKNELYNNIDFLSEFLKDVVNQRIMIKIEDEKTLTLNVMDFNLITKHVNLKFCSEELVGLSIWINQGYVKQALQNLNDGDIKLQIKEDMPGINFVSMNNNNKHIVISRLRND